MMRRYSEPFPVMKGGRKKMYASSREFCQVLYSNRGSTLLNEAANTYLPYWYKCERIRMTWPHVYGEVTNALDYSEHSP